MTFDAFGMICHLRKSLTMSTLKTVFRTLTTSQKCSNFFMLDDYFQHHWPHWTVYGHLCGFCTNLGMLVHTWTHLFKLVPSFFFLSWMSTCMKKPTIRSRRKKWSKIPFFWLIGSIFSYKFNNYSYNYKNFLRHELRTRNQNNVRTFILVYFLQN